MNLKKLILCIPFLLLFLGYFHPIVELSQDLGRHLLTGEIILQNKLVPNTNLFSYTYPDFPFINHHWLSEVVFYLIHQFSGFKGLFILKLILIITSFSLVFFYSLKKNNSYIAVFTGVLYIRILLERTHIRPELFSFLFLSLFIVILYTYRKRFTKWIFLLPLLQLLWVNIHIYFPIGILVMGLFLVDSIFRGVADLGGIPTPLRLSASRGIAALAGLPAVALAKAGRKGLTGPRRTSSIVCIVFLLSCFATLLNPNGIDGALYPLRVFQNYGYSIEENQNIFFLWGFFHKPTIVFFALSATFLFLSLLLTIKKSRFIDWLLAITFTVLAISSIRNFPLFVFATFIPCVTASSLLSQKLPKPNPKQPMVKYIPLTILFLFIIWQVMTVGSLKEVTYKIIPGAEKGIDFFITQKLQGPLFNNFDIGSYIEYRMYPQEKVFVDGRPEAYPKQFFTDIYIPMQENPVLFGTISERYKFNTIFFAHTDQTPWAQRFLKQIILNPEWKLVYLDDTVVLFVKDARENKSIIKKFAITQSSLVLPHLSSYDFMSLARLAAFFETIGWTKHAINVYQQILQLRPNFCPAMYNLSVLLYQQQDPSFSIYSAKYQSLCQ